MKTENPTGRFHNYYSAYSNTKRLREAIEHSESKSEQNFKKYNSAIKTTVGENPSGRLSFKGIPSGAKNLMVKGAEKLVVNKYFNKFLDVLVDNTLIADAIIALGLTTILRPLSIYAIPTKDPVEKKKNNYQVGHSVSTGVLGLATTFAVAEPIKHSVKTIMDKPKKYAPSLEPLITKYDRAFKETVGRIHQPIFLPLRAAVTIAIIPPILKLFGLSKPIKELPPKEKAKIDYSYMSFKGNDSKLFSSFTDVINPKEKSNKKLTNNQPSFKGLRESAIEGLAKGIGKTIDNKFFAKNFEKFANLENWFPHLIAAESLWLSGFYMERTAKSKNIEKDQKLPMILNQGITALLCTAGAYKLDGTIKKQLTKLGKIYERMNPQMSQAEIKNKLLGIKLLGPVVIFTTIYRFVGPVFVTPVANKVSEWIQPHNKTQKNC